MPRSQLSTFVQGAPIALDAFSPTLLHTASGLNTQYIRISGFTRGRRARLLRFDFDGKAGMYALLRPHGQIQSLVHGLPLYNMGHGVEVTVSMHHSSSTAWELPLDLPPLLLLTDGVVSGMITSTISADENAQPILLTIHDTGRSNTDMDPQKGTEALIELFQENGAIGVDVISGGRNFDANSLRVDVSAGVYLFGDLFVD